jgi:GNAT superfamily N-acetyltransferase
VRLTVRDMNPRAASWTRESPPDDRSFIVETWITSCRNRPSIVSVGDWHGVMSLAINRILASGAKVIVAADADADPGVADLLGWLAYEPNAVDRAYDERTRGFDYRRVPLADRDRSMDPLVWYCFVKAPYRKHGVARRLFAHARIDPRGRFHYIVETSVVAELRVAGKITRQSAYRPQLGRPPHERGPHGRPEAEHAA